MTVDLVAFLRARLDEDETTARFALLDDAEVFDGATIATASGDDVQTVAASAQEHIARHDPARVLREVDAKRRIINVHDSDGGHECPRIRDDTGAWTEYECDCQTLRLIALPYADHPDYLPEWRP